MINGPLRIAKLLHPIIRSPALRPLHVQHGSSLRNLQDGERRVRGRCRGGVREHLHRQRRAQNHLRQDETELVSHDARGAHLRPQARLVEDHPHTRGRGAIPDLTAAHSAARLGCHFYRRQEQHPLLQNSPRIRLGLQQAHDEGNRVVLDNGRFALRVDVRTEPRRVLAFGERLELTGEQSTRAEHPVTAFHELVRRRDDPGFRATYVSLAVPGELAEPLLTHPSRLPNLTDVLPELPHCCGYLPRQVPPFALPLHHA